MSGGFPALFPVRIEILLKVLCYDCRAWKRGIPWLMRGDSGQFADYSLSRHVRYPGEAQTFDTVKLILVIRCTAEEMYWWISKAG